MQKGAYSNSSSWFMKLKVELQNSLVVQWLGLRAFTAKGLGSIPRWGIKTLQAMRCSQKKCSICVFIYLSCKCFLHTNSLLDIIGATVGKGVNLGDSAPALPKCASWWKRRILS